MKYFLDTEFHEDGKTIDLLSIGIVSEDGREFYAVNANADFSRIEKSESCAWLRENVMPHIDRSVAISKFTIRERVLGFVAGDPSPEFWGYYADYDWVVFCQLFGRMIDLPKGFPMFCRDIKQLAVDAGNPTLPPQEFAEHHALADARWNRIAHDFLVGSAVT